MKPIGLQTHIWSNNLKSILLLAGYPVLLMGMVWLCAAMIGWNGQSAEAGTLFANKFLLDYFPIILGAVLIWFMISYFFHGAMISNMAHAHVVTRKEEPELYNLLENLCISEGMTMPTFHIIESHALNAFASGINDKTYTITVTRGLLNRLSKDEIEGVLAHELTHIQNRDVRLLMVAIVFTGMISLAAQLVWSNLRYNLYVPHTGRDKKGGGIIILLAILVVLWIGYFATLLMRFALSRRREYMADAGAVRLTKNPDAMMRALMRISGRDHIPQATADIAFMCIENSAPFMGLFMTHPPIERRIQAISSFMHVPIPDTLPPVADTRLESERVNPWLPRDRKFRVRQNPWRST
ncbi:MAG: M48 family metallopeptidase [Rhodospirillales bacterium]|nr:M48 family metallopeptidase [Rhodospirillales bacterium]MCB9965676.1 M48 family metallopeptidase [Rhodospirillales bacterium]